MRSCSIAAVSALSLVGLLSGCASQQTIGTGDTEPSDLHAAGDGYVITAAMFGDPALNPVFTVQGLLEIKGEPVTADITVVALITDVSIEDVIFETKPFVLNAVEGRFTENVPLPEPQTFVESGDLAVSFIDAATGDPVGGLIPMTFAPRAWAAQYAATAGDAGFAAEAGFASQAGNAQTANVAGSLAGNTTFDLQLINGYDNYGNTYDTAKATRIGNMVFLSGLVSEPGGSTLFAELPVGFRPAARHLFWVPNSLNANQIRVDVLPDGRLLRITGGSLDWFSLSGIAFPVAP